MTELRLSRLPDRTPVKLALSITPDLHRRLSAYGKLYAQTYGVEEELGTLIPAMLSGFLDADRAFLKAERSAPDQTQGK